MKPRDLLRSGGGGGRERKERPGPALSLRMGRSWWAEKGWSRGFVLDLLSLETPEAPGDHLPKGCKPECRRERRQEGGDGHSERNSRTREGARNGRRPEWGSLEEWGLGCRERAQASKGDLSEQAQGSWSRVIFPGGQSSGW